MIKHTLIRGVILLGALTSSGSLLAQEIKVKTVEYKVFEQLPEAEEGMDLELTKREFKQYDKQGRIAKQELYLANPIGKLVPNTFTIKEWLEEVRTEKIIKFDEMGDSITAVKTFFPNKGKLKVKEEIIDYLKAPKDMLIKEFEYTEFGKPLKVVFTNKEGKQVGEEVYKYNTDEEEISYKKWEMLPDGNKATESKKTNYTKDGYLESSEKIVKDGKDTYKDVIIFEGTKIKEQFKYKNGEQISTFGGGTSGGGGYDPTKGRVMMEFGSGDDEGGFGSFGGGFGGMLPEVEDEFDDKGNKIKTTETEGIELVKLITYKYDDNSNLLEMKEIKYEDGEEESTKKEEWAYDEENNMTKKAVYKDGKKTKEEQYNYSYYGKKSEEKPEEVKKEEKKEEKPKEEKTDKEEAKPAPSKEEKESASDKDSKPSQIKIVDKKSTDKEKEDK